MKTKILITILLLTQGVFSQNENNRKIGDFKTLKVYDLVNIELVKAEENYAEVTGEYPNNTVIKNKNGELKVRMGIEKRFRGANTKIKIFYNNIEKIYVHEGAFVYSKDTITQADIYIKAERESTKYMQIKYMQDKKETKFKGIISGITDWGLYVEIEENKCEGMVYIKDIKEDRFFFKEEEQALIGRETEKKYRLGDEVYVMVKKTDLVKKHLDFIII